MKVPLCLGRTVHCVNTGKKSASGEDYIWLIHPAIWHPSVMLNGIGFFKSKEDLIYQLTHTNYENPANVDAAIESKLNRPSFFERNRRLRTIYNDNNSCPQCQKADVLKYNQQVFVCIAFHWVCKWCYSKPAERYCSCESDPGNKPGIRMGFNYNQKVVGEQTLAND